ncbi:helix-turn-helix domain-containing protein [Bremerella cremea]|uniref:Helix-turn-helix domain-containing protein n=1 Tax=Bremerella cremea TaxID=1031537 RepID=A0A368KUR4_9BACT|nr:substrate-binding domain-containing protein [Bremerella cremea]RCS54128.1 helix-turn-helix domain-containing protein [Bremerella cremea]
MAELPYRVALVIVPSSDNQVRMIRGVLQYAAETSRIQIIKQAAIPYVPWEQLTEVQPDGIIAFAETQARIDFLRELNIPFVNVTMHIEPTPDVAVVHSDNLEIGRRLADHLQSLGLKHFAFVGHFDWCHNRLRRDGFLQQLADMGHTAHVVEVAFESDRSGDFTHRRVDQTHLQQQIAKLPEPCGIATCHDEFAYEVVECCKNLRKSVPFSMSVVGVNNYRLICDTTMPPLSSISQNSERIGYLAAETLVRQIENESPPSDPVLVSPGQMIVRRSSEFLALDDPEVTSAIEFIRSHCSRPITVTDIVDNATMGRKSLEKRFKSVVGHSIAQEIRLSRMRHAQHLLTSTTLSIIDVAVRSGFDSTSGFIRAFREHSGVTPAEYRSG